ncbi:UPF0182 family membrane protein [Gulosibacter bifidus]|uniref:UPF0182 protein ACFSUQ_02465 n=1 Tax=Gulosibacter bifidus TaxID=272239 RepID=A0ABW5RGJ4_9MICO|nr:UPF0182 family protein [Gulosibacter bifidus]
MMPLIITLAVVGVLIAAFFWFAGVYTDILWFDQLGYSSVLFTRWIATGSMFAVGLLAIAVPAFLMIWLAYRNRPTYAKLSQQLNEYQRMLEPMRRLVFIGVPLLFGMYGAFALATSWPTVLTYLNRTPFGVTDPTFGHDIGFYVFELPFLRGLVVFLSSLALLCFVLSIGVNYLYGGVRVTGSEMVISKSARIQIAVTGALFIAAQGASFWLDRYNPLTASNGRWTGALHTDVHARIPGMTILAGAAVIVALLFVFAAVAGRWRLPFIGVGGLLIVGLVTGVAYPWFVQNLQVGPNEQQLETEYIQHNIDSTRAAYGLDKVEETDYEGVTTAEPGQLRKDAETTANIRLLDPDPVSDTFKQFEQERAYYSFSDDLDVDRYQIDGKTQDAVMAVREINVDGLGGDSKSWVNRTIVYTHGYGLVSAYGSQRGPDGQPVFFGSGMPQDGALKDFAPQVYFGERSPEYSIVGAPEGSKPVEFDHVSGKDGANQTYTTFKGEGGPSLGSWFNRLAYSIKFQSEQILLSDQIHDESQILYNRNPVDRVQAAAPYLQIDSDPYASVVDGELVWILDGYTTSANYPYATRTSVEGASSGRTDLVGVNEFNYMRNSVKATVSAYDGSVKLYAWDTEDPILQTWQKVYPNTLKPIDEMSGELLSHVRYPEDQFQVQRQMLATYHVTSADEYYNQTNAWQLPNDPVGGGKGPQKPYYLTMQMPGQEPAFSLYSTFIPKVSGDGTRNVLTGYLAANANAGAEKGKVAEDYGKLTLLRVKNDSVNGPGQVQNIFTSNEKVANQLALLERGQTKVERGNLLTVPVGDGFLYVQPVFVRSTGETSYPLLRRVLVAFGDEIAFEDTLDAALDEIFAGDAGASAGDENVDATPKDPNAKVPDAGDDVPDTGDLPEDGGKDETAKPTPAPSAPTDGGTGSEVQKALDEAAQALEERTKAYEEGDLVKAAEADKRMTDALKRAAEADK